MLQGLWNVIKINTGGSPEHILSRPYLFSLILYDIYLAQNLCFWTGIIFIGVSAYLCVCVSVCLWVCISIISKRSWLILMKLGRMMYNDNISVLFEDELNRFVRTEVTENPFLLFLLRPFDNIFWCYFPFFIIGEVKCKFIKKHLRLWKMGRARYVFYWTHQILVYVKFFFMC